MLDEQKREKERQLEGQKYENFLKKFNKNVIGWDSQVSVEEWKGQGNKLEDIQELSLGTYVYYLVWCNL